MTEKEPKLLCYNHGCGQEFKESENQFNSCRFHPGTHFFHDAYKGWTCCRKSTDFQEFLNMKGCATGYHTNVKPPEPEKKEQKKPIEEEIIQVTQPRPNLVSIDRPPSDSPLILLQATLSDSLKKQTFGQTQSEEEELIELKVGLTQCVNKGCKTTYQGPQTDSEICKFHPGVPIFHEGLKFWSCCQKRTTDFEVFMQQIGCQTGTHLWTKPKVDPGEGGTKVITCRHDWHQDGSFVHVVIYGGGKKFDPSKSHVKANGVKLNIELFFPEEHSLYQETWILTGVIVPNASSVFMTPMKLDIKLKKAQSQHWADLAVSEEALKRIITANEVEEKHRDVGVCPVDLSDL